MAKKLIGVRYSEDAQRAIKAAQQFFAENQGDSIELLLAEGCEALLLAGGIGKKFLPPANDSRYDSAKIILDKFWKFIDANIKTDSAYYLAEPPKGGYWQVEGFTGKDVLHKSQTFTPNGITTDNSMINNLPEIPNWLKGDADTD